MALVFLLVSQVSFWFPKLSFWFSFWFPKRSFWFPKFSFWFPKLSFWFPKFSFWFPMFLVVFFLNIYIYIYSESSQAASGRPAAHPQQLGPGPAAAALGAGRARGGSPSGAQHAPFWFSEINGFGGFGGFGVLGCWGFGVLLPLERSIKAGGSCFFPRAFWVSPKKPVPAKEPGLAAGRKIRMALQMGYGLGKPSTSWDLNEGLVF